MQSRGRGQENQTHTETRLAISQKGVGVVIQTIIYRDLKVATS